MLKSLHPVPIDLMALALAEVARVLRAGGHLYVPEPVCDGPLDDLIRLFNDEGTVRAAAQAALDAALLTGAWEPVAQHDFEMPVRFADFADFERRMMHPTFADLQVDAAKLDEVRAAFESQVAVHGADFTRPLRVRLLRRRAV